jgi:hypothetical protein
MKEPMKSQDIESNDFTIAHKALASVMNCHCGFALQKPATRNELTVHFFYSEDPLKPTYVNTQEILRSIKTRNG